MILDEVVVNRLSKFDEGSVDVMRVQVLRV